MESNRRPVPGEIYKHFKSKLYQIIAVAYHSETKEPYVVYQALYGDFKTYIRPYDMFMSEVDHIKYPDVKQKYRFQKVEMNESLQTENESVTVSTCTMDSDESGVNPVLLGFFDQDTSAARIEYLNSVKDKIDDRVLSDIAASLDITIEEGDIEDRLYSLINCLRTMAHFECNRLR